MGTCFHRGLELDGAYLSMGSLRCEPGGGGFFTGDTEGYVEEGSCDEHLCP